MSKTKKPTAKMLKYEYIAFINDDNDTIVIGQAMKHYPDQGIAVWPICSMSIRSGEVWGEAPNCGRLPRAESNHITAKANSFAALARDVEKTRQWMLDRYPGEYEVEAAS
jgi:hypothetical protein